MLQGRLSAEEVRAAERIALKFGDGQAGRIKKVELIFGADGRLVDAFYHGREPMPKEAIA